jgi:hypothetical protein
MGRTALTCDMTCDETTGMSRSQFPLVDRLVGGDLEQRITAWRAEGVSFSEIAFRLREQHEINVTAETVRRWVSQFAVDTEPAA